MSTLFQQPLIALVVFLFTSFSFLLILPSERPDVIRIFSLAVSFIALFIGLLSCLSFNQSFGFQFLFRLNVLPQYNLSLTLGADGISMVFLLLTLFVFPVCFLTA
jgi:NADH-quinone oxidoreductase subunit M